MNIKAMRLKFRMTQQEFADLLGIKRQMVSRWETGEFKPSIQNQRKIVNVLKELEEN